MTDIKPFQASNRIAVAGEEKIHHRVLATAGESDGQIVKPGKFAFAGGPNRDVHIRRHLELRPHQDFDSPVKLSGGDGRDGI
jgi:hypothetical protein